MESCRKIATALFLSVAAVCLTSGLASGQTVSSGDFTLPHEAQWGKHTLAKGTYHYTVRDNSMMGAMVTLTPEGDSSHELHMMGLQQSPDASLKGSDSMLIVTHGDQGDTLRGIYLAGDSVEYMFPVHSKGKTVMAGNSKENREVTMRIPVHAPTK